MAVALTHQGRLDEAWDVLDVSGQNPPMVYEWLFFSHQMLVLIGIRGEPKPHALERLRDYWGTDGLTAISSGSAELLRASAAGDGAAAVERLRRRGGDGRAAVARLVPGAAPARDGGRGRAGQRSAATVGRRARVGVRPGRADDGRQRAGHRLLRPLRQQPRPGVPHVGGPARRRAPALALARPGRPAVERRARRRLARRRADRRRLRQRPRDRPDAGAPGRRAARLRRRGRCARGGRPGSRGRSRDACPPAARRADRPGLVARAGDLDRRRGADPARVRDPRPRRGGPQQRRDRQAAVHQHQDGLGARLQHPRQARCRVAHRGRRRRPAPRA